MKNSKSSLLPTFHLTAGYSETQAHSYEVERNNSIRYGLALNYIYNTRPKSITPFKKSKGLKSPYLRFIKDFNFSPLPSRLSFHTAFDRTYNEMKLRNVYADRDVLIDSTVSKDFLWNRGYELNWDLTKSLKFDFAINKHSRIDEAAGAYDLFRKRRQQRVVKISVGKYQAWRPPVNYNHNFNATYNVPLNKFPILSWTSLSLRYNSTYDWTEGPIFEGSTNPWKYDQQFKYNPGQHYL